MIDPGAVLFAVALAGAGLLLAGPLVAARSAWPRDPPAWRDDLLRAASSLRDLDFAHAAGVLPPEEHARLRALVEREAATGGAGRPAGVAPIATMAIAALAVGVVAAVVAVSLPTELGDRAPGGLVTGSGGGQLSPTTEELEARVRARPTDVPSMLALADAYAQAGRVREAVELYKGVLELDRKNVPALNALGGILFRSEELDGAEVAADRVLVLRPRDQEALLLKGAIRYRRADYAGAIALWQRYLEVNDQDEVAGMVRALIAEASQRSGP